MATTTTFVDVKDRLLTLLTAEFAGDDVSVSYAWTPNVRPQMVFLSRPRLFEGDRDRTTVTMELPTIRAGRQPRQETYTIPVTVASFRPELTPEDARTADAETKALFARIDDLIANDVSLGTDLIHWARVAGWEREQIPFDMGWAVLIVIDIEVTARLT